MGPALTYLGARHLDILRTEQLRQRAAAHGLSAKNLLAIDFVSADGSLDVPHESFEPVFSSQNLEHQLDLIHHLTQISSELVGGGCFAMFVPNASDCFDRDLPLTKISDIFDAHLDRRAKLTLGRMIIVPRIRGLRS